MGRKQVLTVMGYPDYKPGQAYRARIGRFERKGKRIGFMLEHLSAEQAGRVFRVDLPLSIRLGGKTSAFFRACGFGIQVGAAIAPNDAIGRTVLVKFDRAANGDWEAVSFAPERKEPA